MRKRGPLGKSKKRALGIIYPFALSCSSGGLQASEVKNMLWVHGEAILKHSEPQCIYYGCSRENNLRNGLMSKSAK